MTDQTPVTDDDRKAHEWADDVVRRPDFHEDWDQPIARAIRAHVPAPPKSLADELRKIIIYLEHHDMDSSPDGRGTWQVIDATASLRDLADRVEAVEKEFDLSQESLAETLDREDIAIRELDEARAEVVRGREIIRKHKERADRIAGERDEALAIIETADWRHWFRDNQNLIAEVERLTAENEKLHRTDNYREFREKFLTVQKGAESNAETPNPADVPDGTYWLIEFEGKHYEARRIPWSYREHHWSFMRDGAPCSAKDSEVTIVSRLVPAPRVITNPDELDELKVGAIGMTTQTEEAWQRDLGGWHSPNRTGEFNSKDIINRFGPMTILYDPEVTE